MQRAGKTKKKPSSAGQAEASKMIDFTRRLLNVPKVEVDALRKKRDAKKR